MHSSDEMYGADLILLETAKALRARGVRVRAFLPDDTPGDRPLSRALLAIGCEVRRLALGVIRRRYLTPFGAPRLALDWLRAVRTLATEFRKDPPELVVSNTLAVTAASQAARLTGIPHLWHVHEILVSPRWFGRALARRARSHSATVIAVSEAVAAFLREAAPGIDPVVLHNGIPDPLAGIDRPSARCSVEQELGIGSEDPLVLFVGRFSWWKGALVFAQAAARMIGTGTRAHFAMVGGPVPGETAYRDSITSLARQGTLRGRLHVVDFTPQVPRYLARATVFVLPSIQPDPFPTVVLEAMHAGIPIVTFAHGGVLEMIRPASAGVEVPPGDVEKLAAAITSLLNDPAGASVMGSRGRDYASRVFSTGVFTHRIVAELSATAGRSAPQEPATSQPGAEPAAFERE